VTAANQYQIHSFASFCPPLLAELESKANLVKFDVHNDANRLQEEDEAAAAGQGVIPQRVAQRMRKRMIPFVGVPFVGVPFVAAVGSFSCVYYEATAMDVRVVTLAEKINE